VQLLDLLRWVLDFAEEPNRTEMNVHGYIFHLHYSCSSTNTIKDFSLSIPSHANPHIYP
jgi:hypothetical protein